MEEDVKIIETKNGVIEYTTRPRKSTKEDEKNFYKFLMDLLIRNENYAENHHERLNNSTSS